MHSTTNAACSSIPNDSEHIPDDQTPLQPMPTSLPIERLGEFYGTRRFHVLMAFSTIVIQLPAFAAQVPNAWKIREVQNEFQLDGATASMFAVAVTLGSIFGVLLGGVCADCIGRKRTAMYITMWVAGLSLAHVAARTFTEVLILRFLVGLAYGGNLVVPTAYLMEFVPDSIRGAVACSNQFAYPVSHALVIAYLQFVVPHTPWRYCYATAPLFPSFLAFLCLCHIPESPRWLLLQGRTREAQEALDQIFASKPLWGNARVCKAPFVTLTSADDASDVPLRLAMFTVFLPPLRRVMLICIILYAVFGSVCGAFGIWKVEIYANWKNFRMPMWWGHVEELTGCVGILFSMFFIDRLGRRPLVFGCFFASGICLGLQTLNMPIRYSLGWLLAYHLATNIGWSVLGTYMSEVFPTKIRGTATGLASFLGRACSCLTPILLGASLDSGIVLPLQLLACAVLFAAAVSHAIPYEPAGHNLDDGIGTKEEKMGAPAMEGHLVKQTSKTRSLV